MRSTLLAAVWSAPLLIACNRAAQGPASETSRLARDLTQAKDLRSAVEATQDAVAKSGIAVADGDNILVKAAAPRSSVSFSQAEVYLLAMEARHRATMGRMTLAELGEMLQDLGWPFQTGSTPGVQLAEFLRIWVTEARKDSANPHSFTPLFLADLAQRQMPPIDLAAGDYRPEALHLTLLELHLFAAAFDRALTLQTSSLRQEEPWWWLGSVAYAQVDPCSQFKDAISKSYGSVSKAVTEAAGVGIKKLVSQGLRKAAEAIGLDGAKFAKALSALGIAAKLWKLVALYSYAELTVTVESNNPTHKPLKGHGNKEAAFTARAGVSDKDWEEFQESIQSAGFVRVARDCLGALGLPVFAREGDIAKDAPSWRVEWRLLPERGLEEHAYISRDNNPEFEQGKLGQLQMNLQKGEGDGDHSASATLFVDILPEKGEHSGLETQVDVTAKATLETSRMPSLVGTLIGAILGLTGALVDVCAGWFQELVEPEAYATLTVTYHEAGGGWRGTITYKLELESESGSSLEFLEIRVGEKVVTWTARESSIMKSEVEECSGGDFSASGSGKGILVVHDETGGGIVVVGDPLDRKQYHVAVHVDQDGGYRIEGGSPSSPFRAPPTRGVSHSKVREGTCKVLTAEGSGSVPDFSIEGRVDPKNLVLSGSRTEERQGAGKETITWNLTRK